MSFEKVTSSSLQQGIAGGVSVVIPAYNRPQIVFRAVESVLAQTVPVDEILIVDDGSDQVLDKVALEKIDPRIRVILLPENLGGGAARNVGIDNATMAWIAFLDSDDYWLPYKLERQIAALGQSELSVAASNVLVVTGDSPDRPYNDGPPPAGMPLSEWFLMGNGGTYQTSTLVLRRTLARRVRFNPSLRRHQDWDFLLRLVREGAEVAYLDECLAAYDCTRPEGQVSKGASFSPTGEWFKQSGSMLTVKSKFYHYFGQWYIGKGHYKTFIGNIRLIQYSILCPQYLIIRIIRMIFRQK